MMDLYIRNLKSKQGDILTVEMEILPLEERKKSMFYQVIGIPDESPLFDTELLNFWYPLESFPGYSEGYDVGICRIKNSFTSFDRMERHLTSCEILIPINDDMFVPIAPPNGDVSLKEVQIVPVKKGELIYMIEGVWHFAAGPLKEKNLDYFVILRKQTPTDDLEMKELKDIISVNL
jgi:hypothetical protein